VSRLTGQETRASGNGSIPDRAKGCAQETTSTAGKAEAGSPQVAARGSSHTPGPWYVTSCLDYWVEHIQPLTPEDKGFRAIAQVGSFEWPNSETRQQEWKANARLLAAAPELLELAKRYAAECAECGGRGAKQVRQNGTVAELPCSECIEIHLVLTKAEGCS
jgi:hypothetical protein